jgi:hypothetical protein
MSVTNRKMFRPRNARNRLNQLGGIMASSPELMQTVQRFELGGPVSLGAGLKAAMPGDMTAFQYMTASPIVQQKLLDAENRYRALNRVSSAALNLPKALGDLTTGSAAGLANLVTSGAQGLGFIDPTQDYRVRGTNLVGSNIEQGLSFPQVNNPEEYAALLATSRGEFQDPSIQRAMDKVPQTMENPLLGDTFVFGASAPSGDQINTMGLTTPDKEPTPDKEKPLVEDDIDAQGGVGPGNQGEDSRLTAAKRGELGPKAQVQAVVAAGTPAEQQDQLQQLMNEFTSNAPEYEGIDKGLALAKIGFAMAAGKSPRALENIANALNQGADTFIKDKQERNAFNRQVQLSALQYGLGEVGKERAEERLRDRDGRKPTIWVASKDGEFNGKPFKKGDNVAVPTSYVEENGVPSGLTNLSLAEAAIRENADVQKALIAAQKDKKMSVSEYNTTSKRMNESAANFASKKTLEELLRKNILQVTEDKITGVQPAFESLVNRAAGAVGIDMGKEYENLEQYEADMLTVANQLVNELLGEGSKTLSDTDRKLAQEIVGYYSGRGGYIFKDTDVLLSRLQRTLSTTETAQANALNEMREITEATAGLLFPSGQPVRFQSALSVASPFLNQQQATQFGLVKGKDNVFRMAK